MLGEIFNAWAHHWGWVWMIVGLCGFIVIEIAKGD
jgi:hypothetical protein